MSNKIILFFILSIVFGCANDDVSVNTTDIHLVTGIELKQYSVDAPLIFGNPNIRYDDIFIGPNPSNGILKIELLSSGNIQKIWVLSGNVSKQFNSVNFQEELSDMVYNESELESRAIEEFSQVSGTEIILNLENKGSGYYRVFVKTEEGLSWNNIVLNTDGSLDIENIKNDWN